jgi:hypothetical protein
MERLTVQGRLWDDKATHRFRTGELATHATPKVRWGRISPHGRVHYISWAIIRWNFMGGTFEKPDITYALLCGPQRHTVFPDEQHPVSERCARCDNKYSQYGLDQG